MRTKVPRHAALLDEALQIEQEETREARAVGFMAQTLAQLSLPHRDQGSELYYERTNGMVTLAVRGHKCHGLPYGTIPRVVLAWISTEAVRTRSPILELGRSAAEFSRKLSLHYNGRDLKRLKEQCFALSRAVISIDRIGSNTLSFEDIKIARAGLIFWNDKSGNEPSLWQSTLTLTEDFYSAIVAAPVPLDLRAYYALRKSPLAMDIYIWLTYRMFRLRVSRKAAVSIPWINLKAQFASDYPDTDQGLRDFKKAFLLRLREVLLLYSDADGHVVDDGKRLTLTPCPPHVARRAKKKSVQAS